MQRFLISIIILTLAGWGICIYMVFFSLPQNTQWIFLFLTTLFVALELSLGLLFHLIRSQTAPNWLNKRELLRESSLIAVPTALSIPLYLSLRYLTLDTWYTTAILIATLTFCEYQILKNV